MSVEKNMALVRRFFEEYNKGKVAAMAAMDETYATDFIGHAFSGEEIRGLTGFKQAMNEIFNAVPDAHVTLDDMVAEGDKVAARVTITGTHKGEFMGAPPTNKEVMMWEIAIVRFAGNKVVEEWSRSDTLGLMQQLGVIPMPKRE